MINGIGSNDFAGYSVSGAGDVNGDGLDDVIIGAPNAAESYVVFGKVDSTTVDLASVAAGTGGFVISGAWSGKSVSGAGDVNGDGLDDVIVGAPGAVSFAGASYVVFGKTDGTAVELTTVSAGTGGFAMNGIVIGDSSGESVSGAGDVNGDGLDDVIVGAMRANSFAGESYVVFGKADGTAVNLSAVVAGTGGFVIDGAVSLDRAGVSVSGAGDVNGDGLDDVIVGAYLADSSFGVTGGRSYVVFGKTDGSAVDLSVIAAGTGGFVLNGIDDDDRTGRSVSNAGDVNGDGKSDLIVSAYRANSGAGEAYVVFNPETEPLSIGVEDAISGDPITNALLFAERSDAPLGIDAEFVGVDGNSDALFSSADADIIDWYVVATGSGYLPSSPISVRQDSTGDSVASIGLIADPNLDFPNQIRLTIDLLDGVGASTGLLLLTDSVVLEQSSSDLGIDSIYGLGEMIFLGVPPGTIDISVPDTADIDFGTTSVSLGTDVIVDVVLTATLIEPVPPLTRAELPGQIVGIVMNTDSVPHVVLPNALLVSTQGSSGISTFTQASGSGIYFFPNIVPGMGEVEAFSEDGTIRGTSKPVDVVTGEVFGNDSNEDTDLSVRLHATPPRKVWVDLASSGDEDGTFELPFNSLSEGIGEVATGGIVNVLGNTAVSNSPGAVTMTKAVQIGAIGGTVTIGGSP